MPIFDVLEKHLKATCEELLEDVKQIPIRFWNESVFRYHLLRRIHKDDPSLLHDVEWKRWDFVLRDGQDWIPVELKFWCHCGDREKQRGGPSKQNQKEFKEVLEKLCSARRSGTFPDSNVSHAFLILVYVDPIGPERKKTFGAAYDDLTLFNQSMGTLPRVVLERVECEANTHLTCKLIETKLEDIENTVE